MNRIAIIVIMGFLYTNCSNLSKIKPDHHTLEVVEEKEEWDIIVLDVEYTTFLNSVARPKEFYSESYYSTRNLFYVTEWNNRFRSGRNPDLYEVEIHYDSNEDYGLDFEYKLFNFFKFVEWKYKVRFQ